MSMTLSDREAGQLIANVQTITESIGAINAANRSLESSVDAMGGKMVELDLAMRTKISGLQIEIAQLKVRVWAMGLVLPTVTAIITGLVIHDLYT